MRYKATLKRDGEERIDLTEPKDCVEDVLKALHNMKPETEGTILYDASRAEVKLMKGEMEESVNKRRGGQIHRKYRRKWREAYKGE